MDSPAPTPTPIQLAAGGVIGTPTWPEGDTATGGQGQHLGGMNCVHSLSPTFHHHTHLSIFVNGAQLAFPMGVGMYKPGGGSTGFIYHAQCYYWLHTHDQTGILHMESPTAPAPNTFTLGKLFLLWGEPLSNTQIAQFNGTVAVYINGALYTNYVNVGDITLNPGDDITLVIGTAPSWIPAYLLPPGLPT